MDEKCKFIYDMIVIMVKHILSSILHITIHILGKLKLENLVLFNITFLSFTLPY